ncbi:MAG: amino acid ABC transporter substrate-binding protein [Acidimicrobiia bacterium]
MSFNKVFLGGAVILALVLGLVLVATGEAQRPIRIGGSLSQTGAYALLGQTQYRGVQLCVRQANMKGGLLGRAIDLIVEDDRSQAATAVQIYERLITEDKVDAVIGPYSSTITEAVANVTEKHRMPMVASGAASSSIFKKGRRFVFMVLSPTDVYFEGLLDLAAQRGLKTIALVYQDTLFPRSTVQGGQQLARKRGLQPVLVEAYAKGTTDFSAVLRKVRAASPDVLAAATYFNDAVAITRLLKKLNINPKMYGATVGVHLPRFHEVLRRSAEFVYGATQWEKELVTLRAGGLVPIGREYPGAREFVEAYRKEFPGAHFSHLTAASYAGCQILLEAMRRAGSPEGSEVREAILKMDLNTVYGAFRVNQEGLQVAHKMMWFQWQDGKKVIVWPRELTPREPRFPTPPWHQR